MRLSQIARFAGIARKHFVGAVIEPLYLRTGLDRTKPTALHAMVTHRCNSKCQYCSFWSDSRDNPGDEMSIEQWKNALSGLRDFLGRGYFVEFSGGEPFVKKDFLELPRYCNANGIRWGVTTNGLAIDEARAEQIVACRPFNTNLSLESTDPEIHDTLRGVPGAFVRTTNAIRFLAKERQSQKVEFPIIVKPTVNILNFRGLPDLVRWAADLGVVVNLQPLEHWTDATTKLWIEESEHAALQKVIDELIAMKASGAPLLTGEAVLGLLLAHFRGEKAPRSVLPCRVGMRNFFMYPNGEVKLCFKFPSIGNLQNSTPKEIWYGELGQKQRQATLKCEQLCLYTCLSHKTLVDKAKIALNLLRRSA